MQVSRKHLASFKSFAVRQWCHAAADLEYLLQNCENLGRISDGIYIPPIEK